VQQNEATGGRARCRKLSPKPSRLLLITRWGSLGLAAMPTEGHLAIEEGNRSRRLLVVAGLSCGRLVLHVLEKLRAKIGNGRRSLVRKFDGPEVSLSRWSAPSVGAGRQQKGERAGTAAVSG